MPNRISKQRSVLDCLATQDDPASPKCYGCTDQHLCQHIRDVLLADRDAEIDDVALGKRRW